MKIERRSILGSDDRCDECSVSIATIVLMPNSWESAATYICKKCLSKLAVDIVNKLASGELT